MPRQPRHPAAQQNLLTAAAHRSRWREEHARVVVAAWKDSGLTMREFAARHSVPQKRLERWSCKLRKRERSQTGAPLRFVPVEIPAPTVCSTNADDQHRTDSMELVLPTGVRVTLGAGFDADALKRLLLVVGC